MSSAVPLEKKPVKVTKLKRRRTFSRTDRLTLGVFIGIPTFLHVALVWFPALATIYLSFT